MARAPSPPGSAEATLPFLHLWRIVLVCAAITHERGHPALALLLLVPLNHFVYNLTATLETAGRRATHWKKVTGVVPGQSLPSAWFKRAGLVAGLHLLASMALVWWYGSFAALSADVKAFGRTWEFWALVATLIVLDLLYRPLVRSLRRLVGATGLLDSRLWSALFLAIAVWIWCDGVFAALYQQLSLYCDGSAVTWCEGGQVFSQSLVRLRRRRLLQHRHALHDRLRRHPPSRRDCTGISGNRDHHRVRAPGLPAESGGELRVAGLRSRWGQGKSRCEDRDGRVSPLFSPVQLIAWNPVSP